MNGQPVGLALACKRPPRRDKICYLAAGQAMKYDLFVRVALTEDLPERHLRRTRCGTLKL
jgi:hypothetical protein